MAYKTKELEKQSLKAIETHNLFFFSDLLAYLPCSKQTMYDHKLDELDTIKGALEKNRIKTKQSLKSKWYKSPNATLQIALMKLIADDDERRKLAQQYTDHTSAGKEIKGATIVFADEQDNNS